METLKIKTKTGTEFAIEFDNIQDMIDFIIAYTERENLNNHFNSIVGVIYDHKML